MVSNVFKPLSYWWFHRESDYLINFILLSFGAGIVFPEAFLKVKPASILIILQLILLQQESKYYWIGKETGNKQWENICVSRCCRNTTFSHVSPLSTSNLASSESTNAYYELGWKKASARNELVKVILFLHFFFERELDSSIPQNKGWFLWRAGHGLVALGQC